MSTDLELKHFICPLATFYSLNSEKKHINHRKIYCEYFLNCERIFFHTLEMVLKNASISPYFVGC